MAAERKRLRSRKDSVLTGANGGVEDEFVKVEKEEMRLEEGKSEDAEDGKEVIIVVKEDLSQLALLGQTVSNALWSGVEGVRKGVWGVVGWA